MSKRVLLAVNSRARRGRGARDRIVAALTARGHQLIEVALEGGPPALSAAIVARRDDVEAVIVCGGDGTLNTAIAGLIATKLPLVAVPLGTFNELARTLGVPADPVAAAGLLDDGRPLPVDVGCVNGAYYFNEASVGLSTRVAQLQTGKLKRRFGKLAIPLATLRALRWIHPMHLEITVDDGPPRVVRTVQLTVANSYRFGGVVENPEASLDDGKLWLYSIDVRGWWNALAVLGAVAVRRFTQAPNVVALRGRRFAVRSRHGTAHRVSADSEVVARLPAEFSIVHDAVTVLVPPTRVGAIR